MAKALVFNSSIARQMEPVQEEVRHPRGHPCSVQEEPGRLQARQAQHLQEAGGERGTAQVGALLTWVCPTD